MEVIRKIELEELILINNENLKDNSKHDFEDLENKTINIELNRKINDEEYKIKTTEFNNKTNINDPSKEKTNENKPYDILIGYLLEENIITQEDLNNENIKQLITKLNTEISSSVLEMEKHSQNVTEMQYMIDNKINTYKVNILSLKLREIEKMFNEKIKNLEGEYLKLKETYFMTLTHK